MARYIARKILLGGQRSGLRSRSSVGPTDGILGDALEADMSPLAQQPIMELENNLTQENPEHPEDGKLSKKEDTSMIEDPFFQTGENMLENVKDDSESSNTANRRPKIEELLATEEVDLYFKFATPTYVQELDWAITFSKYDFPWHEIKFSKFSAKECYKKYTGLIRDAQAFYKKILGGKDKYKKYIAGQLGEAQRVFFGSLA